MNGVMDNCRGIANRKRTRDRYPGTDSRQRSSRRWRASGLTPEKPHDRRARAYLVSAAGCCGPRRDRTARPASIKTPSRDSERGRSLLRSWTPNCARKALAQCGTFRPNQRHNPLKRRRRDTHPGQSESIEDRIGGSVGSKFRKHSAMGEHIKGVPQGQARISLATQSRIPATALS
jgi:hypothetical protein